MSDDGALETADSNWSGQAPNRSQRFVLTRLRDLKLNTTAAWLIRGIWPREGLILEWGAPKCGKSFSVFDRGWHVAANLDYRGRPVTPGAVVYIACEGERGLGARGAALRAEYPDVADRDPPFFVMATRLDLAADCAELLGRIREQLGDAAPVAVIIDTLNRSIGGSESDDRDMGAYIKGADRIRETFRCAVVLIHHSGIEGSRPRGHTSLTGAVDAQLAVKREAGGLITTRVEWLKDGAGEGDTICSRLRAVEVGLNDNGDPITSCIVEPADPEKPAPARLSPACAMALDALREAIDQSGAVPPASNHIPAYTKTVGVELWRALVYARAIADGTQNAKRMAFRRAADQLQARGLIGAWSDLVWLVERRS